jgi:hypothetical protein
MPVGYVTLCSQWDSVSYFSVFLYLISCFHGLSIIVFSPFKVSLTLVLNSEKCEPLIALHLDTNGQTNVNNTFNHCVLLKQALEQPF